MFRAFELVRERQSKIVDALNAAGIEYALSGSNATYQWIASVEESAVRAFRNVEFIVEPSDEPKAVATLGHLDATVDRKPDRLLFRYRPNQRDRHCDCMFLSGARLTEDCYIPHVEAALVLNCPALTLPVLVHFQLTRWLLDDRVDLRDMIDIGLINSDWLEKLPPNSAARLKHLLDTPDG